MAEKGEKFIILVMMLSVLARAYGSGDVVYDTYDICPRGHVSGGQQMDVISGRSEVDCLARCSQLTGCVGINTCPADMDDGVTCALMTDHSLSGCNNLTDAESFSCHFTLKSIESEPPEVCQNGGTQTGNQCVCPMQYSGSTCSRLVRDCEEVYQNGYDTDQYNGVFNIQPVATASPFEVRCKFDWGHGITYPSLRSSAYDFNKSWNELRAGFGDPSNNSFFAGLENLHHLLNQAEYQLHVYFTYQESGSVLAGSAFYDNFYRWS